MKIGILSLQGAFIEHVQALRRLKIETVDVRLPSQLSELNGLIIPGGESTTILKLMHIFDIFNPLREMIGRGFPVWGTCAGMICLAKQVTNSQQSRLAPLEVMDIQVRRNAFGRQVDSFEIDLEVAVLGPEPFHAVFIRAPLIEKVEDKVSVLAKLPDCTIVAARQNNMLATSFHPELTGDSRFHQYFAQMAGANRTD
jgi:5'-phosphate synthase pdxT subunit